MKYWVLILVALILSGCSRGRTIPVEHIEDSDACSEITHARGFTLSSTADGDVTLVDISDPQGKNTQVFHFALVPRDKDAAVPDGYVKIQVPVERVICMTSLQLSNFILLDQLDRVSGITSTRHLFNPDMKRRLADGRVHKIGIEGNFDNEVILAVDPELILISPFKRGGYDALRDIGVPLMPHLGYKELDPLGQAEWIKLIGLLTGTTQQADSAFAAIESRYDSLKTLAMSATERPKVFCGEFKSGNWYAQGGKSFLATLFTDAGADYFLHDNNESGGVTLDFETLYSMAHDADYWRLVNSHKGDYTYEILKAEDSRYADFKAYRDSGVIYCNMTQVPFYEAMPVEPDQVLADFIHVFHPELLPDHKPRFYSLLKK
ncbi:MAG: ABC transporter substrate-binding protein [Muribaculum sp.]|nr:ABC transporter substrate-binding protein [Muribaculum sp.]